MTISERFLNEAKIGTKYSLVIGPKEIVGVVVSLDLSSVQLRKDDGILASISLDSIAYYEPVSDGKVDVQSTVDSSVQTKTDNRFQQAIDMLNSKGDSFFDDDDEPDIKTYADVARGSEYPIKKELDKISNSLDYAINQMHETKIDDYKIRENIGKLKQIISGTTRQYKYEAANMLGALYYQLRCDKLALSSYLDGDDNESAFMIARAISSSEDMEFFACRHFLLGEVHSGYIIKWLTNVMVDRDDYSVFNAFKPTKLTNEALHGAISVAKAVLLSNGVPYDDAWDSRYTSTVLEKMIDTIRNNHISKNGKLLVQYENKIEQQKSYIKLSSNVVKAPNVEISKSFESDHKESVGASELASFNVRYTDKALEAVETDPRKAIEYYQLAIQNGEKLSSNIDSCINLMLSLGMYDEALDYLDNTCSRKMDYAKYLNKRLDLFLAAKDPKYKKEIKRTVIYATNEATNSVQKARIKQREASIMASIRDYEEAIRLYTAVIEKIKENRFFMSNSELQNTYLVNAYKGLCFVYLKKEDLENAKEVAKEILRINPGEENALAVMNGENPGLFMFLGDTKGVSDVSKFLLERISRINLDTELKNNTSIKEGVYVGGRHQAIKIIDAIKGNQVVYSPSDEIKSNYYFVIAKIIRQLLDREGFKPSGRFSERMFQIYAAIGSYFYGNYKVLKNDIDTARYCFFEAFSLFNDSEQAHVCWAAATVRYIQSYFYSEEAMKKEFSKLYSRYEDKGYSDYEQLVSSFFSLPLYSTCDEFVVGMIEMISINNRVKDLVLSRIVENDSLLRTVDGVFRNMLGESFDSSLNFDDVWNDATEHYLSERKNFISLISDALNSSFVVGELQNRYDRILHSNFARYLNSEDKYVIDELNKMFSILLRYNEESEFNYKSETLERANEIRARLEDRITKHPTYISYVKVLPMLISFKKSIVDESILLYRDAEPFIIVEISGLCSIVDDNVVNVPIAFKNKKNVQNADNVTIQISGENVSVINDEKLKRMLLPGNGVAIETMVEFKVSPNVLSDKVFSVNVGIQYQYKISLSETKSSSVEVPLSVPLYNETEFTPIKNAFEPYRNGSVVIERSMFYGRDKEIDAIIQQISDGNGNVLRGRCLALYGQTRTGKSSLLYHLNNKLRELNEEQNIIVNIGSIGEENLSGDNISEFLYSIIDELQAEINSKHPVLKKYVEERGLVIDSEKLLSDPERSQLYFNSVFKELNRLFDEKQLVYNIIIMIDEFTYIYDWIRKGTMTDRIMKFWKAFIQNNGLFAIVIGQDHMMKFVDEKQFTNDFGSTDLRKVTYLSKEDAKRLMYEPIMLIDENSKKKNRFQEGALDRLYELTAGSAFLIMNLCAGLVEYLNQTHSVYITRAHVDDYLKKNLSTFEESRFFEPQYDDKSEIDNGESNEENKRILHRIAQLSNKKEWTPLSSVIKNKRDEELIKSLQQRDVIVVSNNERCKIKVGLYKEWIIEKFGVEGQR